MRLGLILLSAIALAAQLLSAPATVAGKSQLRVGVAAVSITPFGPNPDWDGTITDSGVWGEKFQDLNHNGRWDPGELLPELFYGVEKHHRADCQQANTGRPKEVSVRQRMTGKFKFIFGLCPDEFGYIVPGYDFLKPSVDATRGRLTEAADPCKSSGAPDHYHETNSASSMLAPAWACATATLLQGRMPEDAVCSEFHNGNPKTERSSPVGK